MSRHAGNFTGGVLVSAIYLAGSLSFSAMAEGVSRPDFAPNPSVAWFAYSRTFIPPARGAGPVRQHPAYPHVSNDEFRLTGKQPTFAMGDPDSPILQPWARDVVRAAIPLRVRERSCHNQATQFMCGWPTDCISKIIQ